MRVAIIGGGYGFSGHLPAFSAIPGVEVVVVADSGSGKVKSQLPEGVAYAPSWQDALSASVDAVSIVVPPARQQEIVMAALSQKLHVFCDKPFGINVDQANAMNQKAASVDSCVTAINYQFRYEQGIQELKKQIDLGVVGALRSIDFSWITAGRANPKSIWTWRNDSAEGGGVIGAFFSHAADLVWWLTQKEAISIFGQTGIFVKDRFDEAGQSKVVTAEEFIVTQLQLEGDLIVSCRITNCQEGGNGMRVEIRGSEGVLTYRHAPPFTLQEQSLTLAMRGQKLHIPIAKPQIDLNSVETRLWSVCQSASQFVQRARGGTSVSPPSFADGLRVHKMMDGLRKAALQGERIFL